MRRSAIAAGIIIGGALLGAGCASQSSSATGSGARSQVSLEPLKALEGTWMMKDEKGQEQVALVTRVIAAGSVVHETMFPGSPHEMVNTYHLDNDRLVVTHYCAAGNQPRMECRAGQGGVYAFRFRDITNRATPDEMYMGELTVTIKDADHISQDWAHFAGGKREAGPHFELTRKKG